MLQNVCRTIDLDMLNLDLNTLNVHLSMKIVTLIHTKLITAGWFAGFS